MVPLGIQEASCGIFGNCIGANNVILANRFFWLMTSITFCICLCLGLMICNGRYAIAAFYTDDENVKEIVE